MLDKLKYSLTSNLTKITPIDGMQEFVFGKWLFNASKFWRVTPWSIKYALFLEGGQFYSITARKIMLVRCQVSIGAYSYGACFKRGVFGPGTQIGRYVSMGSKVRAFQANHPVDRLSTHAFFFNSDLGFIPKTNVPFTFLSVEHDAWIGESVVITPGCSRIGLGAIVGAGSIVTKDVPDFAVVGGNPAKILKYRFTDVIQEKIRQSKWWESPISECAQHIEFFKAPLGYEYLNHPLLSPKNRQNIL